MSVLPIRIVVASAVVGALTFAATPEGLVKLADRVPMDVTTIVEKTPAADDETRPPVTEMVRLQRFLALQSSALDLRPWQYDAWSRYSAALLAMLSPLAFIPLADGDPIAASERFAEQVIARGSAATSLAVAADDLRGQLRPEQVVRISTLIPPPWRLIGGANDAAGASNSVGTSSPRPSTERDSSRIER